jgi:tRNA(Glu) U13 pseudouridine synthase TruD
MLHIWNDISIFESQPLQIFNFIFITHKLGPIEIPGNAFHIRNRWGRRKMINTNKRYIHIILRGKLRINIYE